MRYINLHFTYLLTSVSSFILIRPTVWPQYSLRDWQTKRQDSLNRKDKTDNGPIA